MNLFRNNIKKVAFLFLFVCAFIANGQKEAGIMDTTFNNRFPRIIQPFFGGFAQLNTEGTTDKVGNMGVMGGFHFDFWRFHATGNISRFNAMRNDDGFQDNIWNKELSAGVIITKSKDVGLALIGSYDEGKRPVQWLAESSRKVQFVDNETGMPFVNEVGISEKTFLFELGLPYYGAGFGLIVKNKYKSAFFEISLRYLFLTNSSISDIQNITTSPYNINVPRSVRVEGLSIHKQGVLFKTAYTSQHLGFNLDFGTRPVLYSDYVNKDDKLGIFGRAFMMRLAVYFKVF